MGPRLVGMVVAVAALGAASSAFGGTDVEFKAKIRPVSGGDEMQYYGRVSSDVEECRADRTVRITSSGRLIGTTATQENGKFSLVADPVEDGSSVKFKLKRASADCPAATVLVEL